MWATESSLDGRVIYHKEPIRSSQFVKKDFWKNLRKIKMDMVLLHARATSPKGGNASNNLNNHPFVNQDRTIGMVHNGNIDEADFLKEKYETKSDTDSECLLRIFEHGISVEDCVEDTPVEISCRLNGIKEVWSHISTGAMAVALGERISQDHKVLFLFRNEKRPLWVADLRDVLGQIFFFSSPEIWYDALDDNKYLKDQCWGSCKLIELPDKQIWCFSLDESKDILNENIFKFLVKNDNCKLEFSNFEKIKKIKPAKLKINLITNLDKFDNILPKKSSDVNHQNINHQEDLWYRDEEEKDMDIPKWGSFNNDHEKTCKKIIEITNKILTECDNLSMEGSICPFDYSQLLESLEQTKFDLEGTLQILKN